MILKFNEYIKEDINNIHYLDLSSKIYDFFYNYVKNNQFILLSKRITEYSYYSYGLKTNLYPTTNNDICFTSYYVGSDTIRVCFNYNTVGTEVKEFKIEDYKLMFEYIKNNLDDYYNKYKTIKLVSIPIINKEKYIKYINRLLHKDSSLIDKFIKEVYNNVEYITLRKFFKEELKWIFDAKNFDLI